MCVCVCVCVCVVGIGVGGEEVSQSDAVAECSADAGATQYSRR